MVAPVYNVANPGDLAAAIYAIDTNAIGQLGGVNYVINLTADVAAGGGIPGLHLLAAGDTLTIHTNGHLLDGASNGAANGDFTFAATGAGGSTVLTGGQPTFDVASATDMANVITAVDSGLFANSNIAINLTADVPLIEFDAEEFDRRIGTPGLHRVGRSIHANERRSVLPIELIRKYENDSFWLDPARNPYNIKVV
jgi:hypothetical protein